MKLRVLVALAVVLSTSPALAQSDEKKAEQLFVEGEGAFNAGDYRRAASAFEAAYRSKEHPAVLWNAARSWQRAGEELLAANDLSRYLARSPADAPHRDEATRLLATMIKAFGRARIQGAAPLEVDGEKWSEDAPFLTPGEHAATSNGRRKVFVARAGETVSVIVDDEPPPPAPSHKEEPKPDEAPSALHSPWIVVVGGALVLAGVGVTTWSGLDTVDRAHTFDRSPSRTTLDDGNAGQLRTNVLIGVTGVVALATLGAAVFLADWRGHR